MTRFLVFVAIAIVGIGLGFAAGFAVTDLANLIAPWRPGDDDTLRDRLPVALAYAVQAGTTLVVIVAAWRRFGAPW